MEREYLVLIAISLIGVAIAGFIDDRIKERDRVKRIEESLERYRNKYRIHKED